MVPMLSLRAVTHPRRVAYAAATVVALVTAVLVVAATQHSSKDSSRVNVPVHDRHLPISVNAPGTWSDAEGVQGPVAALGISTRTRPEGIFAEKESLALFAVSAVDGSASWIRPPGFSLNRWGFVGGITVSPDGQYIGWVRPERHTRPTRGQLRLAGWSVMDTETGTIQQLTPDYPWVRGTVSDLQFSGDSRYLLTSYETPDTPAGTSRTHQFVAWDVANGTATVIEPPGRYWLPNLGAAPTGVVWARGRHVFRADPATGQRALVTMPRDVVAASWGPNDTSFAYIGRPSLKSKAPWQLYAGASLVRADNRVIDLPPDIHPSQLLGWRDATHVVVGHYRRSVHIVDVITGEFEEIDLAGHGEQVNAPYLAGSLWQQPLVEPVEPEATTDPRRPARWGAVGVLAVAGAVLLVRRKRTRAQAGRGRHTTT